MNWGRGVMRRARKLRFGRFAGLYLVYAYPLSLSKRRARGERMAYIRRLDGPPGYLWRLHP